MRATRPHESDRELLMGCRKGSQAAWEALVRKYRHLIYSIALKSGLDADGAADVFQAVFLSLLRSIDELEQLDTLVPWLVTTTKRQSWKTARGSSRRPRESEEILDSVEDPRPEGDDLLVMERQVAVRAALDRLDARCRRLLDILFYSDPAPSYGDISREMKMPVPSIGPTRLRCLEKLRREIEKSGLF